MEEQINKDFEAEKIKFSKLKGDHIELLKKVPANEPVKPIINENDVYDKWKEGVIK